MKKIILVVFILSVLAVGNGFAANNGWSIGAGFYFGFANSASAEGAMLDLKFPGLPVMFGFSAVFGSPLIIGITADWWLFQTHLVGPVDLYIGPGLFLRIDTGFAQPYFGIRVPVGFQIFIVKAFEIYFEPAIAFQIVPDFPTLGFQASVGFRFWF